MKKLLSLLLASCMLICLIPNGIFAEDCIYDYDLGDCEHIFNDWVTVKEATCIDGLKIRRCTQCGYRQKETIGKTRDHTYSDWEIVYKPTCAREGLKTRKCTICGYVDEEVIEKFQEHGPKLIRVVPFATFYRDGTRRISCNTCGELLFTEEIPMLKKAYLSQNTFVYDGTEKKPTMYFVDRNDNIIPSTYYTLTETTAATDVGDYSIYAKFNSDGKYKGGYWASRSLCWRIIPKDPINKNPLRNDNAFTARWSKISKKAASGYQVQYSRNANMSNAKKKNVVGANKTKVKINKLKSKKKYYVRVRTYKKVNGKKVYSKWSAKKSVKTK